MLDTVKISCTAFKVTDHRKIVWKKTVADAEALRNDNDVNSINPLFVNNDYFSEGYYNQPDGKFFVNIKSIPYKNQDTGNLELIPFLSCHTSANRILEKNHLHEPTSEECVLAVGLLVKWVQDEVGIDMLYDRTKISRMDSGCNLETLHPVSMYLKLLRNFSPNRMKTRDYDSTVLHGNASNQIIYYDKIKDLKAKYTDEFFPDANILRQEKRWMTSAKIKSVEGKEPDIRYQMDNLKRYIVDQMTDLLHNLSKHTVEEGEILTLENFGESLNAIFSSGKIRKGNDFKKYVFASFCTHYGVNSILTMLKNAGADKSMISRIKQELKSTEISSIIKTDENNLLDEVIQKTNDRLSKWEIE